MLAIMNTGWDDLLRLEEFLKQESTEYTTRFNLVTGDYTVLMSNISVEARTVLTLKFPNSHWIVIEND